MKIVNKTNALEQDIQEHPSHQIRIRLFANTDSESPYHASCVM